MNNCDIGVIGAGTMGAALCRNLAAHGNLVCIFDKNKSRSRSLSGKNIFAADSLAEFAASLASPRVILLCLPAGAPTDSIIDLLLPYISSGDVVIDGGNSNFRDTERRVAMLKESNIELIGMGISGGEQGALFGPCLMPGGSEQAWARVAKTFTDIAAAAGEEACCAFVGSGGAGHFVKTVHNGIEYAVMQLYAEAYTILRDGAGLNNSDISSIFSDWKNGELGGYFTDITAEILNKRDGDGATLIDKVFPKIRANGTGSWAAQAALELNVPFAPVSEAVFARVASTGASAYKYFVDSYGYAKVSADELKKALHAACCVVLAQGFELINAASKKNEWSTDIAVVAKIWRNGCILRSALVTKAADLMSESAAYKNLLMYDDFSADIRACMPSLRSTICAAVKSGLPVPVLCSAQAYIDGFSHTCGAALIQAQRDCFGSHGFERTDADRGVLFHANWSEQTKNSL